MKAAIFSQTAGARTFTQSQGDLKRPFDGIDFFLNLYKT